MKNIILFGHKNSGKTYIGQKIASILNYAFIDTDLLLEKLYLEEYKEQLTYKKIYQTKGESFFRELEKKAVFSLKANSKSIISLGGGTAADIHLHPFLQDLGTLIYLKVGPDTFLKRNYSENSDENTPFFVRSKESLKKIFDERNTKFTLLPSKVICVDIPDERKIIKEVIDAIK